MTWFDSSHVPEGACVHLEGFVVFGTTETRTKAIGFFGTGELNVLSGGEVTYGGPVLLGQRPSGSGTINVIGTTSHFDSSSSELKIGFEGTGELNVESGGVVKSKHGNLGVSVGSAGTATITGAGSHWNVTSNSLIVGSRGTGELNILDGGKVTFDDPGFSTIGLNNGSIGTVNVEGAGSQWVNTTIYDIGTHGTGILNIRDGGFVSIGNTTLGDRSDGSGTVNVTGVDSHLRVPLLIIGELGSGKLNVESGGKVEATSSTTHNIIGSGLDSTGMAIVTGANSQWTSAGDLHVGHGGPGELQVLDGAVVSNKIGKIGVKLGSTGKATVSGLGSSWESSQGLNVTRGTLDILAGGVVTSKGGTLVNPDTGQVATATVSGAGSQWNSSDSVFVGGNVFSPQGTGTLNIQNDGNVNVAGTMKVWDAGTVNLQGGTLTLATLDLTAPTATDDFNMTGGTLVVGTVTSDFIQDGGTLSPGASPGLTQIIGDYLMNAGSILFEIGGLARGTDFDAIDVDGIATLNGVMDVNLINSFAATDGDSFQLVSTLPVTSILGLPAFDFTDAVLSVGLAWDTSDFQSQGTIKIGLSAVPEPSSFAFFALVAGATGAVSNRRRRKANPDKKRT